MTLTTHVLDTARGLPGAGIPIALFALRSETRLLIASAQTDADGRTATALATGLETGVYEIVFSVATYFERLGSQAFYDEIGVRIRIADAAHSYHVPLLLSPWSYATYRGS